MLYNLGMLNYRTMYSYHTPKKSWVGDGWNGSCIQFMCSNKKWVEYPSSYPFILLILLSLLWCDQRDPFNLHILSPYLYLLVNSLLSISGDRLLETDSSNPLAGMTSFQSYCSCFCSGRKFSLIPVLQDPKLKPKAKKKDLLFSQSQCAFKTIEQA